MDSVITSIKIQLNFANKPSKTEILYVGRSYSITYINRRKKFTVNGVVTNIVPDEENSIITIETSNDQGTKSINIISSDIRDINKCGNFGGNTIPPKPPKPLPNNKIQIQTITSGEFKNITPNDEILYFISDTHEIYKGDTNYTQSIFLVDSFPEIGILNKLYINLNTYEAKVYSGTEWISISGSVNTDIIAEEVLQKVEAGIEEIVEEIVEEKVTSSINEIIQTLSWKEL